MSDEPKKPERLHTLELTIDADSLRDLEHALIEFSRKIALDGLSTDGPGVSGGGQFSWIYRYIKNEGQTPEGYRKDLERWLEWDRKDRGHK